MLYPKIEDCVDRVRSKYALAVIVAKRVKELSYKMPGEFNTGNMKELSYALTEVLEGKIAPSIGGA